jgi:hypothetical protein
MSKLVSQATVQPGRPPTEGLQESQFTRSGLKVHVYYTRVTKHEMSKVRKAVLTVVLANLFKMPSI